MMVLHLEDHAGDVELIGHAIVTAWTDAKIVAVDTREDFVAALDANRFDVILSDFSIPGFDGMEALAVARQHGPDTPFIFVSGTIDEDHAIAAVRQGADDYVMKDRPKRLLLAIARAMRGAAERRDRRAAEARTRELADALNQAREAITVTDLEGKITFWNAGAERMFGWTAAESMGRTFEEVTTPRHGAAISTARAKTIAEGEWSGELRMQNRRGETVLVEGRQTLIRSDAGRAKACLCINTDITDRKRLEEQLLRAQRLENLGLLAAGIAHDLNNMLAPILLATPMLRDHVSDTTALKLLDTLEKSAERGALLVRQILSFAHGASGEYQVVQVKHLLRDIAEVMHGTFPKSIRLEDYVPSDLWPVTGNPTQIHQVLLNLCVNARDAMPDGGTLSLRAENIELDAEAAGAIAGGRAGSFLVVEVADTGTGIAPELLERIWEPFFTTKDTDRGTGLGLSTVRGIVRAHHGFIEVKSAVGRGSMFRVFLPVAAGAGREPVDTSARALPRGAGELILVVDDEQQIREMLSQMLGRHGYRVLVASDGIEAAAVFAQRAAEIRLVISDLHMPNLDGATLARVLRQINSTARMLVVSGMASGLGNRSEFKPEDFADALLMKPFKAETLLETVHDLLHRPSHAPLPAR